MPRIASIAFLLSLWFVSPVLAGPLSPPPGGPSSTHKTLTEVEPRTPLNPADAPADALAAFRIKSPGSYYLTGDLTGFAGPGGPSGIVIESSDVTIDLGGFTLRGDFFTGDGIRIEGALDNVTIRNGVVTGWAGRGIDLWGGGGAAGALVEGVRISANGLDGLRSGRATIIRETSSVANARAGFVLHTGSIATECTARLNDGHGFQLSGATVTACESSQNGGVGFSGSVSVVDRCTARLNDAGGVEALGASLVRANFCSQNGAAIGGVGILVSGFGSRIEDNVVMSSAVGVATDPNATTNFFSRNTTMDNAVNWSLAPGNIALVVEAALAPAIVGNAGGVSPGSTNPNANYAR